MGDQVKIRCHVCNKAVECTDALRTKLRNRKTKSGTVDAWKGNCPTCKNKIYKIIGHS